MQFVPIQKATCVFAFLMIVPLSSSIPVAMPPELTLDLPLAEIPGVWKLTRLALLVGPTPMLWAYRKLSRAVEESKPSLRRSLLNTAERVQTWALRLAREEGFDADGENHIDVDRNRGRDAASTAELILGTGLSIVPSSCLRVYKEIISDPRLRNQRLRDSRVVLGGGPKLSLREIYQDYRTTLETTIVVAREHIEAAQLSPEHARLVQNLVLTRMEAR